MLDLELGDRASRVPLTLTLRYRPGGEIGWSEAQTINISRSGVLFAADESLEIDTPIEMNLDLPLEVGGAPGAAGTSPPGAPGTPGTSVGGAAGGAAGLKNA